MKRTIAVPALAGLVTAAIVFAAVLLASGDDERTTTTAAATPQSQPPQSQIAAGHTVFVKMGCGSCHTFAAAKSEGPIGPNLDVALGGYTRIALKDRITRAVPDDQFSGMPDFGDRMTAAELDALVTYLLESRRK